MFQQLVYPPLGVFDKDLLAEKCGLGCSRKYNILGPGIHLVEYLIHGGWASLGLFFAAGEEWRNNGIGC
jgi:hypothetical protein